MPTKRSKRYSLSAAFLELIAGMDEGYEFYP